MREKLCEILKKTDAIMITSPHGLRYFTGFKGEEGISIIGADFLYLIVDSRYTIAAKQEAPDFNVIEYKAGKLIQEISSILKNHKIETLAFEDADMSVAVFNLYKEKFNNASFVGMSKELNSLRMIKTAAEIDNIRQAERIGDIAFSKVLPLIKAGVSEIDIATELEYQMRKHGADSIAFGSVVVSGLKSGMPHGKPDNKKFERGDFVTMDFGCTFNGYCSDMTRTVVIEKASEEQMKIYNTVLCAQLAGLDTIKAGITGKYADGVARKIISDAGYGEYFGHSLGHGVGLVIHEFPNLSPLSDTILEENMVVTCEPGIYIESLGGVRIEDTVVVKNGGIENLCASPKELIICG